MKLNFHINSSRVENNGNNVLKNIIGLFDNLNGDYNLVQHPWLSHDEFLRLIRRMNAGMQVSFSETYNIVTCDHVSQNVPVVVSEEIDWMTSYSMCSPTDVDDIACKLERALNYPLIKRINFYNLHSNNAKAKKIWLNFLF